ncbi:ABC transporter permease subunit [Brevibacillus fluminis]|uniref:ABC transporter permease subunit n=1 Tax=Brevibacillus fluminis TaxID=511487 RepID=A0A3M8DQJ5_9BACL|nr:ABC transporter permease subunit [Brevibacillus fluminis]RNB89705.1 ABC transporter permease subunit [Brevibacillus fluminis]
MRKGWIHYLVILVVGFYLVLPLVATFLYSISQTWANTILPTGYTLSWYEQLFSDQRFIDALGRTALICILALLLSVITMVLTVFVVTVYVPKLERFIQALVMLPYAIPGVVAAVGLIKMYASKPIVLTGTIWIIIGAYYVLIMPYMYQGIRNSLRTIDVKRLLEAAEMLGASKWKAFVLVVLPNLIPGILVSSLLSLSILFGEFVLANMLVGGHFETIQIYLMKRLKENGHLSSAIVITYFVIVLISSLVMLKLGARLQNHERKERVS